MGGVGGGRIEGDADPHDGRTKLLLVEVAVLPVCDEASRVDRQIADLRFH